VPWSRSDLLAMIERSFMSRRNTIVVPASKTQMTMELLIAPILSGIIEDRGGV
jgi:phosphoribulokinase